MLVVVKPGRLLLLVAVRMPVGSKSIGLLLVAPVLDAVSSIGLLAPPRNTACAKSGGLLLVALMLGSGGLLLVVLMLVLVRSTFLLTLRMDRRSEEPGATTSGRSGSRLRDRPGSALRLRALPRPRPCCGGAS